MDESSAETKARWQQLSARKGAVVPGFFEVFPDKVLIRCGKCGREFVRNLVHGVEEPVFVCPQAGCGTKNWVPVYYNK